MSASDVVMLLLGIPVVLLQFGYAVTRGRPREQADDPATVMRS